MLPSATLKAIDMGFDNALPLRPRRPAVPLGTVRTSLVKGISGAVRLYWSVVGVGWAQVPETGGASVGIAAPSEIGLENFTVMGEFEGTFVAPAAGVDVVTASGATSRAALALGVPEAELDCFDGEVGVVFLPNAYATPPTTATRTTTPITARAMRRPRRTGLPLASSTCMLSLFSL